MKTTMFFLLIGTSICMNGFSQNRIADWDIGKITMIEVERRITSDKPEVIVFSDSKEINLIFSFLKQVDLKTLDNFNFKKDEVLDQWLYKITLKGLRDQVIFCRDFAAVGKTIFSIEKRVPIDFDTLIENCRKGR